MATLTAASVHLRVTNGDRRRIFSVSGISTTVSAETVAGFVFVVEKNYIHNSLYKIGRK